MNSKAHFKFNRFFTATAALLVFAGTAHLVIADSGNKEIAKGDLAIMQGRWRLIEFSYYRNGKPDHLAADQIDGVMTISGNRYRLNLTIPDQTVDQHYQLKVFPHRTPKAFDVTMPDGRKIQGIYELSGNRLRRCYTQPGFPRPAKLEEGDQTYQVWVRDNSRH